MSKEKNVDLTELEQSIQIAAVLRSLRRRIFPDRSLRYSFFKYAIRPALVFLSKHLTGMSVIALNGSFEASHGSAVVSRRRPALDAQNVQRILVSKLDHIGDFILCAPSFDLIRRSFPSAKITLLCGSWNQDMALRSGYFDEVICINIFNEIAEKTMGASLDFSKFSSVLGNLPLFDIAIDFKLEDETREILNHVAAKFKAGYETSRIPVDLSLSLPHFTKKPWDSIDLEHHNSRVMYLLASAVVGEFTVGRSLKEAAEAIQTDAGCKLVLPPDAKVVVGINTGAGVSVKKWPLEYFAELIQSLIENYDAAVVLFGSKSESQDAQQLMKLVASPNLIDATGLISLPNFISVMKKVSLLIGNDTGSTHLAAAIGTQTICLFSGNGMLARFEPIGPQTTTLYRPTACAPCGLKKVEDCSRDHACMRGIKPFRVMEEVERILGKPNNAVPRLRVVSAKENQTQSA